MASIDGKYRTSNPSVDGRSMLMGVGFLENQYFIFIGHSIILLVLATAQKNRTLKSYLFRGTRYKLEYEICAQN